MECYKLQSGQRTSQGLFEKNVYVICMYTYIYMRLSLSQLRMDWLVVFTKKVVVYHLAIYI